MNKMKYIMLAGIAAAAAVSCERSHLNDNLYDPSVYLIDRGVITTDVFYDVQGSYTTRIHAYCGSYYGGNPEVSLTADSGALDTYNAENGTSMQALPDDCWSIDASVKTMSDSRANFDITFDCEKLKALSQTSDYSDLQEYCIPLRLKSNTEGIGDPRTEDIGTVAVIPVMKGMSFELVNEGVRDRVLTDLGYDGGLMTLIYKVITPVENQWENGVKFTFNATGVEGTEYDMLPEDAFTVTSSADGFTPGVSEITWTVTLDRSKMPGFFYSIVAKVESLGGFYISGSGESVDNLVNVLYYDQSKMTVTDCNSYYSGHGPELTIDGNKATQWESAYNKTSHADANRFGSNSFELPFEITYELAEPVEIRGVEFWRRNNKYCTDLTAGHFEVSSDGTAWTTAMEFDCTGSSSYGPFYSTCATQEIKYLKFVATKSGRQTGAKVPLANLAELSILY